MNTFLLAIILALSVGCEHFHKTHRVELKDLPKGPCANEGVGWKHWPCCRYHIYPPPGVETITYRCHD